MTIFRTLSWNLLENFHPVVTLIMMVETAGVLSLVNKWLIKWTNSLSAHMLLHVLWRDKARWELVSAYHDLECLLSELWPTSIGYCHGRRPGVGFSVFYELRGGCKGEGMGAWWLWPQQIRPSGAAPRPWNNNKHWIYWFWQDWLFAESALTPELIKAARPTAGTHADVSKSPCWVFFLLSG